MRPRFNLTGEPAVLLTSLIAPAAQAIILAFTSLSPERQAGWNAVAVAVAGAATALAVSRDRLLPALLGAAQAVLALLAVYGWGLSAEQATGVSATLAVLIGQYVRTQVAVKPPPLTPRPPPAQWIAPPPPVEQWAGPPPDPMEETQVADIQPVPARSVAALMRREPELTEAARERTGGHDWPAY